MIYKPFLCHISNTSKVAPVYIDSKDIHLISRMIKKFQYKVPHCPKDHADYPAITNRSKSITKCVMLVITEDIMHISINIDNGSYDP